MLSMLSVDPIGAKPNPCRGEACRTEGRQPLCQISLSAPRQYTGCVSRCTLCGRLSRQPGAAQHPWFILYVQGGGLIGLYGLRHKTRVCDRLSAGVISADVEAGHTGNGWPVFQKRQG